jgi:glycosyltransferase involved in cell wall biosynthesis
MVRTMARGLVQAGLEVHVAATDDNGHGRLRVPHGVPVVEDGVTYRYFRRQTRFYTSSWPLSRWLARHVHDYDLIHIHALFSFASVAAAYWAARAGVPYVVRPLGTLNRWGMEHRRPWLKRLSFALIERRILRGAARIHYVSEQERIEAARLSPSPRAIVVPLGVDTSSFARLPPRGWLRARAPHLDGRFILLFLSRLDHKKGVDLLLEAFEKIRRKRPDVALIIGGSGAPAFEAALRYQAERSGVSEHVWWAGFLSGEEKLAALADADVYVLPSHSENFGVTVVEAMACGLPVTISDQVAIHREVSEVGAGVVVALEPGAVADAIAQLANDPAHRLALGARARALAHSRFSMKAMTAGLVEMYSTVAAGRATSSPRNSGRVAAP